MKSCISAGLPQDESSSSNRPFHDSMQACHQDISFKASWFRRWVLSRDVNWLASSKSRRQKVRPGGTTLAANDREPVNESNSRLVYCTRCTQKSRMLFSSDSFEAGSLISHAWEPNSMPKNVTIVDGGHTLSGPSASGTRRCSTTASNM